MKHVLKDVGCIQVFWDVVLYFWVSSPRLLDPEDEGSVLFVNAGNYSPTDTGAHSSRFEYLATPL
jgi:hypothetical protein